MHDILSECKKTSYIGWDGCSWTRAYRSLLGWAGQKTRKVPIRRIQHCTSSCLGAIAADATDANRSLLSLVGCDRELYQAKIKLTNLRMLEVLQTQLSHWCDQTV